MEPRPGSVRETDSTATLVHDAQQDTIANEPIPTQCLTTCTCSFYFYEPHRHRHPRLIAHYATSYVTVVRKQNYFTVLWEEPNPPYIRKWTRPYRLLFSAFFLSNPHKGRY